MANATDTSRQNRLAALAWLVDMGADEAIGEAPGDHFALARNRIAVPPPVATPRREVERPAAPRPASAPAPQPLGGDAIADARAIARDCASLEEVAAALARFEACPLQRTATNLVYTDGHPTARVLFIGEAPGRDEDLQGRPFVGRSGQLLDRMLAHIGLSRVSDDPAAAALITNVIFWRPPGNRKPTEAETLMCMPFVLRTIEIVQPEVIVCLGATPAQRLLGVTDGILRLRGHWRTWRSGDLAVPLLPTLHPAYLLRQPAQKRLAWRDLLDLRKVREQRGAEVS